MVKKADLEAAHVRHDLLCKQAAAAAAGHDYLTALRRAEDGLPVLREALAFQRRFLKIDRPTLTPVFTILRLGPPLFARRSLDGLEAFYAGLKKAERDFLPGFPDDVAAARGALALAVRLWTELARPPEGSVRQPGTDGPAAGILAVWVTAGLVNRVGPDGDRRFALVTNLRRPTWGKCPGCGCLRQATTAEFLDPLAFRSCGRRGSFVITQRAL